jgi:hypothetical protein
MKVFILGSVVEAGAAFFGWACARGLSDSRASRREEVRDSLFMARVGV